MYFPTRDPLANQARAASALGMEAWQDPDGTLMGWRTPEAPANAAANAPVTARWVVFHGNAGSALDRDYIVERIQSTAPDAAVFLFEYPGYGARPGTPSEASIVAAADRALSTLAGTTPVYLVGESLGAAVAAAAAGNAHSRVTGLVLITPFNSMTEVAAHHYPWLPVRLIIEDRYESEHALAKFCGPVAFVLAADDEVVPPKLSQALFNGYQGPKKMWNLPNAGHNTIFNAAQWWPEAAGFVTGTHGVTMDSCKHRTSLA